jgi:hypothetical protein
MLKPLKNTIPIRISENPNGAHASFVNRQFWTCFKLLRNILCWHGFLADRILVDLGVTTVLNRYLLTALGMNPDPADALNKARHIAAALPTEWLASGGFKEELKRLSAYLTQLGSNTKGGGRDFVQDVVNLIKFLGFAEESESLKRQRLK